MPFAFMGEKGPVLNRQFRPFFLKTLPNKMSRVILVRSPASLTDAQVISKLLAALGQLTCKTIRL